MLVIVVVLNTVLFYLYYSLSVSFPAAPVSAPIERTDLPKALERIGGTRHATTVERTRPVGGSSSTATATASASASP